MSGHFRRPNGEDDEAEVVRALRGVTKNQRRDVWEMRIWAVLLAVVAFFVTRQVDSAADTAEKATQNAQSIASNRSYTDAQIASVRLETSQLLSSFSDRITRELTDLKILVSSKAARERAERAGISESLPPIPPPEEQ